MVYQEGKFATSTSSAIHADVKCFIDIYDMFNHEKGGPVPRSAIRNLGEWCLLPKEGEYMCPLGTKLVTQDCPDGWAWR